MTTFDVTTGGRIVVGGTNDNFRLNPALSYAIVPTEGDIDESGQLSNLFWVTPRNVIAHLVPGPEDRLLALESTERIYIDTPKLKSRFINMVAGNTYYLRGYSFLLTATNELGQSSGIMVIPVPHKTNFQRLRRRGRSAPYSGRYDGDDPLLENHGPPRPINRPPIRSMSVGVNYSLVITNELDPSETVLRWQSVRPRMCLGPSGFYYYQTTQDDSFYIARFGMGNSARSLNLGRMGMGELSSSRKSGKLYYSEGYFYWEESTLGWFIMRVPVDTTTGLPTGPVERIAYIDSHNPDSWLIADGNLIIADEPTGITDNLARVWKIPIPTDGSVIDYQYHIDLSESGDTTYEIWTTDNTAFDVEFMAYDELAQILFFFIDGLGDIKSYDLDGNLLDTVVSAIGDIESMALDTDLQKLYYVDTSPDEDVIEVNYDGTGSVTHVVLHEDTAIFLVDPVSKRLVYTDGSVGDVFFDIDVSTPSEQLFPDVLMGTHVAIQGATSQTVQYTMGLAFEDSSGNRVLFQQDYIGGRAVFRSWDSHHVFQEAVDPVTSFDSGNVSYNPTDNEVFISHAPSANFTRIGLDGTVTAITNPTANCLSTCWDDDASKFWFVDRATSDPDAELRNMNRDGTGNTLIKTLTDPLVAGGDIYSGSSIRGSVFAPKGDDIFYLWWSQHNEAPFTSYYHIYLGRMEKDGSNSTDQLVDLTVLTDPGSSPKFSFVPNGASYFHTYNGKDYLLIECGRTTNASTYLWIELDDNNDVVTSGRASFRAAENVHNNTQTCYIPSDWPRYQEKEDIVGPWSFDLADWWSPAAQWFMWQESTKVTLADADTDPIGNWKSIAGNLTELSNATAGERPLLTRGSADWNLGTHVVTDGSDDDLSGSYTVAEGEAFSMAVVVRSLGTGSNAFMVGGMGIGITTIIGGQYTLYTPEGSSLGPSTEAGVVLLVATRDTDGAYSLYLNGVLATQKTDTVAAALSGVNFDTSNRGGEWGDIMLFDYELDQDGIDDLWTYTQRFYGAT